MLNRVFNVVFNYSLGVFTAVSELSRRRLKTKSVSQSKSLQNIIRVNLSRLTLGILIGCGLISTPTWAAGGFMVQNGKLVYCSNINATDNTCSVPVSDANLSSNTNNLLTWNGTNGFSTSILTATSKVVTPSITLKGKLLAYKPEWAIALGGNTGLSFDGKPITPYYGVNSGANGGNYYGQGATGDGAIAIGYQASAQNKHSIAIGRYASVIKNNNSYDQHGIAIGGGGEYNPNAADIDKQSDAAMAGRNVVAIGYNVRMGGAGHSFGLGTNMIVKGTQNFVLSAAPFYSNPTQVYGYANTVIGANNKLDGRHIYETLGTYEKHYGDIASNLVFGDGNTITGTVEADARDKKDSNDNIIIYKGNTGAYKNIILGPNNKLNGDNYHNRLLASDSILEKGAHHNTLLGGTITVNENVHGSYVLGNYVNVTANNSVYFGDRSIATLKPTSVDNTTYTSLSDLRIDQLNTLITAGELGQQGLSINGQHYIFAGRGKQDGGVITVGGITLEKGKNVSYGRIIQNVAPGLIGANSTDAINGSQLYALWDFVKKYTINVATGSGGSTVTITPNQDPTGNQNSTGNENNGTSSSGTTTSSSETAANSSEATTSTTNTSVSGTNSSDDQGFKPNTFNVHTEQTMVYTNADGKELVKAADGKFYLASEVKNKALFTFKDSSGQEQFVWYEIAENKQLIQVAQDKIPVVQTAKANVIVVKNPDGTTNTPTQIANVASGLGVDTNNAPVSQDQARTLIAGNAKDGNGGLLIQSGTALNTAANLADLQAVAQAGTTFVDDNGTEIHRPVGTALNIKGGASGELSENNIGVIAVGGDTLHIKLAKDIQGINSITFNEGDNGQSVKIDQNGLNNGGNRIRNVAPGIESSDAATVGQLKDVENKVNGVANTTAAMVRDVEGRLSDKINGVAATSAAIASLPQSYIPGKSMISVGTGVHHSQQAVAIGVSRVSDNGKIVIKLNASHNTMGNTTFGAGAGFLF
ncbi:YadA-like family protein [Gallibacterium genomosp. 3]|nr:YadA-like family protein [Gallibacterium genomosp. 3]